MNKLFLLLGAVAADPNLTPTSAVCDGAGNVMLSFNYEDSRDGDQVLTHFRCSANEQESPLTGAGTVSSCEGADKNDTDCGRSVTITDLYDVCGVVNEDDEGNAYTDIRKYNADNTIYASVEMSIPNSSQAVTLETVAMSFSCTFKPQYTVTADDYGVTEKTTAVEFTTDFQIPDDEFSMSLDRTSYSASSTVSATVSVSSTGNFALLDAEAVSFAVVSCTIDSGEAETFDLINVDTEVGCGAAELSVDVEGSFESRQWVVSYMAFIMDEADSTYTLSCSLNVCIASQKNDGSSCDKALKC